MPVRPLPDSDNIVIDRTTLSRSCVTNLQSLAALISPELRQQFSKKLFAGDIVGFDKLVEQLEAAPNWSVALRMMEHYFYRAKISPYHNDATHFSDIVYKRYFPYDAYIG